MVEKTYISASELLRDSFLLGRQIIETEFRPDFIVGVWRGGTQSALLSRSYWITQVS